MQEHDSRTVAASTRRSILKLIPGVVAASAVPAIAVAASPAELPVQRVDRLAEELALALDEWASDTGIQYVAHVHRASSGRGFYFKSERFETIAGTLSGMNAEERAYWHLKQAAREAKGVAKGARVNFGIHEDYSLGYFAVYRGEE